MLGVAALGLAVLLAKPDAAPPPPAPAPAAARPADEERQGALAVASYELEARLDAEAHRVEGRGTIRFTNASSQPLHSLFFHLYLNAFKNERTLFLRSPFGAGRSGEHPRKFGYIDVKKLVARELGGVDLWPGAARHSPGDPDDETDIEVPLPAPLAPGVQITLDLEFEARLPEVVERTGYAGSFHFVGQWFPKLARLEPDGRFAHFAFHPQAEFYADFGSYRVRLDVPADFIVAATGRRTAERRAGARRIVEYAADSVHDFAWTAWDGFVEARERIAGVEVTFVYPRGHGGNQRVTAEALRFALPWFSRRYGAYPYPTLAVVHPPNDAEGAGGMEYPTLITTGGPWYTFASGSRALEAVTIHELGHQWFYGLLASNEAEAPFLDEGVNSYAELAALSERYGAGSALDLRGLRVGIPELFRAVSAERGTDEVVAAPAAAFRGFPSLGALVYSRSATLLATLERVFGARELQTSLAEYARRQRFARPTGADLVQAIEAGAGSRAKQALERGLFERGGVDYVARDLISVPDVAPRGHFERPSGRQTVTSASAPEGHRGSVTVVRRGAIELPVEVLLVAADGSERRQRWDGRGSARAFEYQGPTPLAFAVVDPEHRVLLDDDLFNNYAADSHRGLPRVHERLAYVAALLLGGIAP